MNSELIKQLKGLREGNPPLGDAGLFGVKIDKADMQLAIIPVPFEAPTSYGGGTSDAPQGILKASHQLDLFDRKFGNPYLCGIGYYDDGADILELNQKAEPLAKTIIHDLESKGSCDEVALTQVNAYSRALNQLVYKKAKDVLDSGKCVGLVGGDHSSPLGLMKALSEVYDDFGVVHIDAHHDLRIAYEGFTYSHASIMHNALNEIPQISQLLSMGIRDFSEDEYLYGKNSDRIQTLYDSDYQKAMIEGKSRSEILHNIIKGLPRNLYISFDIDGLDPALCPNTGTPVPGGFDFGAVMYLLELLDDLDHKIIGFDLSEVSPGADEWDANVGARVLYKLCGLLCRSQDLKELI